MTAAATAVVVVPRVAEHVEVQVLRAVVVVDVVLDDDLVLVLELAAVPLVVEPVVVGML